MDFNPSYDVAVHDVRLISRISTCCIPLVDLTVSRATVGIGTDNLDKY